MNLENITLLTVSFNNNLLTGMMLKSFAKQIGELPLNVVIVDNGNAIPVDNNLKECLTVIDNFKNKLLNKNYISSRQHCWAIDYALKNYIKTKYCLLVDNDILFKPRFKNFLLCECNDTYDCYGQIGWDCTPPDRLLPYCCLINVNKFKSEHLSYFDNNRIIKDCHVLNKYDTGYSFYMDIKNTWKIKNINLNDYVIHYKSASLHKKDITMFLSKNRELF